MNDQTPNDLNPTEDAPDEEARFAPSDDMSVDLPPDETPADTTDEIEADDEPESADELAPEPEIDVMMDPVEESELDAEFALEPDPNDVPDDLPDLPQDEPDLVSVDADELDALASELDALGLGYAADEPAGTIKMDATASLPAADVGMNEVEPPAYESDADARRFNAFRRPERRDFPAYDPPSEFDVDTALGAVQGLDSVMARQEAEEQVYRDEEARIEDILSNPMPRPQPLSLERGRPLSLLPGLALVGLGAYLTFAYTAGTPPPPSTVAALLLGGFAVALLTAWAGSGRWNRGTLFIALWGLFSAVGVYAAANLLDTGLVASLVLALGLSFFLSGLFARPTDGGMVLVGLMLLVGGGVALVYTLGMIPAVIVNVVGLGWYVVVALVALVILLPLIRRARG